MILFIFHFFAIKLFSNYSKKDGKWNPLTTFEHTIEKIMIVKNLCWIHDLGRYLNFILLKTKNKNKINLLCLSAYAIFRRWYMPSKRRLFRYIKASYFQKEILYFILILKHLISIPENNSLLFLVCSIILIKRLLLCHEI